MPDHPSRRAATVLVAAIAAVLLMPRPGIAADPAEDAAPAPSPVAVSTLAPGFPAPAVRQWQTGLLRPDRIQHASLSMTLGLSIGLLARDPATGFSATLGLGVLKELWDMRRSRFDVMDLAADAAGAALGAAGTAAVAD